MEQLAIGSLILNVIGLVVLPILIRLNIIKPQSSKERMKERIQKELNRLLNADIHNVFIPIAKMRDLLIRKYNPLFRMRFCEIFMESTRELDEKEFIIIDRFDLSVSLNITDPVVYPPAYNSSESPYKSLREIDPNKYIGLNNTDSRAYIESCELSMRIRYERTKNSY